MFVEVGSFGVHFKRLDESHGVGGLFRTGPLRYLSPLDRRTFRIHFTYLNSRFSGSQPSVPTDCPVFHKNVSSAPWLRNGRMTKRVSTLRSTAPWFHPCLPPLRGGMAQGTRVTKRKRRKKQQQDNLISALGSFLNQWQAGQETRRPKPPSRTKTPTPPENSPPTDSLLSCLLTVLQTCAAEKMMQQFFRPCNSELLNGRLPHKIIDRPASKTSSSGRTPGTGKKVSAPDSQVTETHTYPGSQTTSVQRTVHWDDYQAHDVRESWRYRCWHDYVTSGRHEVPIAPLAFDADKVRRTRSLAASGGLFDGCLCVTHVVHGPVG